ncbi:hypothetical protein QBC38DRAFT_482086 [Podospora fimiseda]|uniref:Potassium channel tetramerisation-type BTB domain-containing protein n=1 Tax=Podospora fimiseda TaxID=252190 RepID=A0AAN7BM20_9PEZI|nr:hypothetical protein QBC38DRAFT_482086 [Podospora fimiseda]
MANPKVESAKNNKDSNNSQVEVRQESSQPTSTQHLIHHIPKILPHERVFPIQIGSELFKLSGASISSDAPSYFSQYFQCQIKTAEDAGEDISTAIRTLYIDRDPETFKDISLHLQGYHVQPRDATHFVRLFADAQFYSLPKLISQLYDESVYTSVGHREFQIPRELFTDPGNTPNFFSLGFAAFFSSPDDLFPGLDKEGLLRPPSIVPPAIPGRSPEIFQEILHLLRGYPVNIRNETHRAELLRDCRYFRFKGLEQRLIPHSISFNLSRRKEEIVLRLRDILKSGISISSEPTPTDPLAAWVNYGRPFVDDKPYELVLEIGDEVTRLQHSPGGAYRAEFYGDTKIRISKMFEVIATKLNLPQTTQPLGLLMTKGETNSQPATPGNTPLSEDLVKVIMDPEASVTLDGKPWSWPDDDTATIISWNAKLESGPPSSAGGGQDSPLVSNAPPLQLSASGSGANQANPRKRKRVDMAQGGTEDWIIKNGQWRLKIQSVRNGKAVIECCLVAVKLDAFSSEQARNAQRSFLG